jgi:hypothetical protein
MDLDPAARVEVTPLRQYVARAAEPLWWSTLLAIVLSSVGLVVGLVWWHSLSAGARLGAGGRAQQIGLGLPETLLATGCGTVLAIIAGTAWLIPLLRRTIEADLTQWGVSTTAAVVVIGMGFWAASMRLAKGSRPDLNEPPAAQSGGSLIRHP